MGDNMSRVSRVTAGLVATALAGVLTVATVQPASSAVPSIDPPVLQPAHFTVSSFNVLGASHTKAGGKRASGARRIVWVHQLLTRHHVDVAGFQEMQASQLTKFLSITKGDWAVYPGLRHKRIDSENSIGWRTDKFVLVQATTVKIPYFNGKPRAMPLVLLRDKTSGMMAYFANFHNPAETKQYRHQGHWRSEATRVEVALQNQLYGRGLPRFMTGDMNDRASYFCRVARHAPVIAARPKTYVKDGKCYANKPRAVDWILGARKVTFSNYFEDRSPLVDKTTDHPVISSDVTVDPTRLPRAWATTPPAPVVPQVTY
jgi:hypothetical protein